MVFKDMYQTLRHAVMDPSHFNAELWTQNTFQMIQEQVSEQLQSHHITKHTVPLDQIRNVIDSITESNPRVGTKETVQMVISYIVNYIVQEETVNKTPSYDSSITKYDGSFGIQRYSQGSLGIKKKGLNRTGRMF
jgi:hypothetical protein